MNLVLLLLSDTHVTNEQTYTFFKYLQLHFSNFTAPNLVQLSLTSTTSHQAYSHLYLSPVLSPRSASRMVQNVFMLSTFFSKASDESFLLRTEHHLMHSIFSSWRFSLSLCLCSFPLSLSLPPFFPSIPSSSAHSGKPIFRQYTTDLTLKQQLHTTQQLSPPRHIGLHAVPVTHQLGSVSDP